MLVWVVRTNELAIGPLYIRFGSRAGYAKNFIVISLRHARHSTGILTRQEDLALMTTGQTRSNQTTQYPTEQQGMSNFQVNGNGVTATTDAGEASVVGLLDSSDLQPLTP